MGAADSTGLPTHLRGAKMPDRELRTTSVSKRKKPFRCKSTQSTRETRKLTGACSSSMVR